MRFSVIIPVYNVAPYLAACLDSIVTSHRQLADPRVELELICIDDGSTDGSGRMLDEAALRIPECRVIHQENRGPGMARNRGLAEMSGDYFLFVDSDDSVTDDFFSVLVELIRRVDASLYSYGAVRVDTQSAFVRSGALSFRRYDLSDAAKAVPAYSRTGGICACNMCYVRKFADLRFQDITHAEDSLFVTEAFVRASSIAYAENVLYRYVQRPGSLTHRRVTTVAQVESCGISMLGRLRLLLRWRLDPAVRREVRKTFDQTYLGITGEFLLAVEPGRRKEAWRTYADYGARMLDLLETAPVAPGLFYRMAFRRRLFLPWLLFLFLPWEMRRLLMRSGIVRRLNAWRHRKDP